MSWRNFRFFFLTVILCVDTCTGGVAQNEPRKFVQARAATEASQYVPEISPGVLWNATLPDANKNESSDQQESKPHALISSQEGDSVIAISSPASKALVNSVRYR